MATYYSDNHTITTITMIIANQTNVTTRNTTTTTNTTTTNHPPLRPPNNPQATTSATAAPSAPQQQKRSNCKKNGESFYYQRKISTTIPAFSITALLRLRFLLLLVICRTTTPTGTNHIERSCALNRTTPKVGKHLARCSNPNGALVACRDSGKSRLFRV